MIFLELKKRVRSLLRDFSSSIYREEDVINYINEGVERLQQLIPELEGMNYLSASTDVPNLLPPPYHHLLSIYSASRCFGQDEKHYQASTYMNEFEVKVEELIAKIEAGEVVILDADGNPIVRTNTTDYVVNDYFYVNSGSDYDDDGGF